MKHLALPAKVNLMVYAHGIHKQALAQLIHNNNRLQIGGRATRIAQIFTICVVVQVIIQLSPSIT